MKRVCFTLYYTFLSIVSLISSIIMGIVTSLYGKTTGKIGSIVFSTSGGETIAREYNPHVANPNTPAQVNQRARLKLMSQLSTALAPVIAMTKDGLVSKRNKFVKKNFENTYALNGVAQVSYENVQLTEGSTGLPQVVADINTAPGTAPMPIVALSENPSSSISRVVYCAFVKSDENKLSFIASHIATTRGSGNYRFINEFPELRVNTDATPPQYAREYVIYAYGMADTSEKATVRYGNLNVQSASDIANLVANRTMSFEDFQFTQTRGATIGHGTGGDTPTPVGQARVFVTALGMGGSVTGGGTFPLGTEVTVNATPNSGYVFSRWVYNGTNLTASTSAQYTFTLNQQVDLIAVFDGGGNESL